MKKLTIVLVLALFVCSLAGCPGTPKAASEPKFSSEVKDGDTCQPVREQKSGGVIAFCKGKCPTGKTCGNLYSRKKGTQNPWKDDTGDPYESSKDYNCLCY